MMWIFRSLFRCDRHTRVADHLHSLLAQVCSLGQLFTGVDVWILVLSEQILQSVQLLLCEDGAVTPNSPLNVTEAFPAVSLCWLRKHPLTPNYMTGWQQQKPQKLHQPLLKMELIVGRISPNILKTCLVIVNVKTKAEWQYFNLNYKIENNRSKY